MRRREARRRILCGVVLVLAALGSQAHANTRSQQLYTQALLPFHAQRWSDAHALLDNAAAADPDDPLVAYYRGLTNARLGFPDKAIRDIEQALSLRPDLTPAVLDLGILYFQTGQYQLAAQWLQRAYQQPSTRFSAAFFLGMTQLRTGNAAAAEPLFADAAKDPALRQSALYYQAIAALRSGNAAQGRQLFEQVRLGPANTETAQVATQYLSTAPAVAAPLAEKPWSVHGAAGFGYDSNVTLTPNNTTIAPGVSLVNCYTMVNGHCQSLDTKGQEDGFFAIALGGQYRLFSVDQGQGSFGYDFYQSVHFQTPTFDLQNHELHLDLSTTRYGFVQAGVSGFYDFYMLDYQSFYNQGRGVPWVTFFEGPATATQVYYQFISQDYSRPPFSPFRDAYNNAVGARQFFLLGAADRYASIGYQWDDNDPLSSNGTDFAYYDNIIEARVDFGVLDWVHATLGYAVDLQDYKHPNSRNGFNTARHDFDNQIVVRLMRDFTANLSAELAYYGVINDSNIPDFQYDRNVAEAMLRVNF